MRKRYISSIYPLPKYMIEDIRDKKEAWLKKEIKKYRWVKTPEVIKWEKLIRRNRKPDVAAIVGEHLPINTLYYRVIKYCDIHRQQYNECMKQIKNARAKFVGYQWTRYRKNLNDMLRDC